MQKLATSSHESLCVLPHCQVRRIDVDRREVELFDRNRTVVLRLWLVLGETLVIRKRYHVAWVDIERDLGLLVRALQYLCGPPNRHPVGIHVDNERCIRLGVEAEKLAMSPWW